MPGRKCDSGCSCGRHKTSEKQREAAREFNRKAWSSGVFEGRAEKIAATRAAWTPEQKAKDTRKRSEGVKANWAAGVYDDVVFRPNVRPRVSQHEYALAPYLVKLGYRHNHDAYTFIGRKVPDFVDIEGRRVFEYFGSFWHPDRSEEQRLTEYYASMGWTCEVLWEDDLFKWLASHQELVSEEEHQFAWKAAHVNNGYRKPELAVV